MSKIYSYVLRFDDGAAPNPFGGICTLTICKPVIRRNAAIGDWIIGTGSKWSEVAEKQWIDLSDYLVYAMKITKKMTLEDYAIYCKENLPNKIPLWKESQWPLKMGDCIYQFADDGKVSIIESVHDERNLDKDLSGKHALLSDHFYYFGLGAQELKGELK